MTIIEVRTGIKARSYSIHVSLWGFIASGSLEGYATDVRGEQGSKWGNVSGSEH